jgi:MFS family permease
MGMFFAPVANIVLSAVRPIEEGKASGANNAIREVGGVLGVAVLASIFAGSGGYGSASAFTDGLVPAIWVGAIVVAVGAAAAFLIPRRPRVEEQPARPSPKRPEELVAQADAA